MKDAIQELKYHFPKYTHQVQSREVDCGYPRKTGGAVDASLEEKQAPMSEKEAIKKFDTLPWVRPGSGGKPKGAHRPIQTGPDENLSEHLLEWE